MTYQPKTVAKWRGETDGGVRRKGFTADIANLADLAGVKPPAPTVKCITAADNSAEHRLAAARIRHDAELAEEAAVVTDAEEAAQAAMRAARSGDFAELADLGPGTLADAKAETARAKRIEAGCRVAEKATHRDLLAEASGPKARDWMAKIWAASVTTPYLGDSMREAAAHESNSNAVRHLLATVAIATDPDATDPQIAKALRKAFRDSTAETMPTGAGIREEWSERTRERDAAEAAALAEERAENIRTASANSLAAANGPRVEVSA